MSLVASVVAHHIRTVKMFYMEPTEVMFVDM